jgi:hypothetical protein
VTNLFDDRQRLRKLHATRCSEAASPMTSSVVTRATGQRILGAAKLTSGLDPFDVMRAIRRHTPMSGCETGAGERLVIYFCRRSCCARSSCALPSRRRRLEAPASLDMVHNFVWRLVICIAILARHEPRHPVRDKSAPLRSWHRP